MNVHEEIETGSNFYIDVKKPNGDIVVTFTHLNNPALYLPTVPSYSFTDTFVVPEGLTGDYTIVPRMTAISWKYI